MQTLVTCVVPKITESTLKTIHTILEQSKNELIDYTPTLITELFKLLTHTSMNVRLNALKLLTLISTVTTHVVLPMRTSVIQKLKMLLDDRKRLVRKEAMKCSHAWHLLGVE